MNIFLFTLSLQFLYVILSTLISSFLYNQIDEWEGSVTRSGEKSVRSRITVTMSGEVKSLQVGKK